MKINTKHDKIQYKFAKTIDWLCFFFQWMAVMAVVGCYFVVDGLSFNNEWQGRLGLSYNK